ncbi:MAG: hypothetical protein AB1405_09890 [Bdellovibrionota bacterium]
MPCPLHSNHPAPAPSEAAVKLVRSEKFVKDVCGKVEKGCTPHVVAFARGLLLRDFWIVWALGLGAQEKDEKDRDGREKTFADFVHKIQLALAEARLNAEERVHAKNPQVYLESSPACTGGGSWNRKRSEPPTEEELFEQSPLKYLRYAESCIAGAYSLDPAPRRGPEFETPCEQCRVGMFEEIAAAAREALGEHAEEVEVDLGPRCRALETSTKIAPPPLGEGAAEQRERADHAGTTLSDSALSRPSATLSQGERGIKGPAP